MISFREYIKLNEIEDFQDQIASGPLGKISIGKLAAFAKTQPKLLKTIPIQKVIHDLSWWQGDEQRMMNADTRYPILVLVLPDGGWTVTDGLNRLKKAVSIEKKTSIQAYIIPIDQLPPEVFLK